MKYTDRQILDALLTASEKNRKVMEHLYHQILPKVQKYVLANSGNQDDAFDVFQDAMIAFCKYVRKGKFNSSYSIDGFIYSIARNCWINKARKEKRMVYAAGNELPEEHADHDNALECIITSEREKEVRHLLEKLEAKCQELLRLSIYEGLSGKEICNIMGFASENGVKTQKYKCKKKLLDIMKMQKSSLFDNQ